MTNFFKHKMRGKSPGEIIAIIIFGGLFIVGLATLFAFVVMWLWNWLMPTIFGLTTLTFWQTAGIIILSKLLLGGCNFGDHKKKSSKKHKDDNACKTEFNKWKHYDKFWEEEGNKAYEIYIERVTQKNNPDD